MSPLDIRLKMAYIGLSMHPFTKGYIIFIQV